MIAINRESKTFELKREYGDGGTFANVVLIICEQTPNGIKFATFGALRTRAQDRFAVFELKRLNKES